MGVSKKMEKLSFKEFLSEQLAESGSIDFETAKFYVDDIYHNLANKEIIDANLAAEQLAKEIRRGSIQDPALVDICNEIMIALDKKEYGYVKRLAMKHFSE